MNNAQNRFPPKDLQIYWKTISVMLWQEKILNNVTFELKTTDLSRMDVTLQILFGVKKI